jgi:hypothetical protein
MGFWKCYLDKAINFLCLNLNKSHTVILKSE